MFAFGSRRIILGHGSSIGTFFVHPRLRGMLTWVCHSHIEWHLEAYVEKLFPAIPGSPRVFRGLAVILAEDIPGIAQTNVPRKSASVRYCLHR